MSPRRVERFSMGTQRLGGRGDPAVLSCRWQGADLDAWHGRPSGHQRLLTPSLGWAGAPCPPRTTSSSGPRSRPSPLGLHHPWARFGGACRP